MRSSSLERNSSVLSGSGSGSGSISGDGGVQSPVAVGVVTPSAAMSRLQATRTVWRSHDNEISYTSLNYEEDDQPVNYSLKYSDEAGAASTASTTTNRSRSRSEQSNVKDSAKMESSTAKKVLFHCNAFDN